MPLKIHLLTGPTPTELTPTAPNPTPSTPPTQLSPSLAVRVHIRAFTGYPAPAVRDPEYFSHGVHKSDLFSIHFFFVPPADIPGDDLVLANTFDRPIRSRLPYFFPAAWKALKWVDPGIEGDCYADRPEVYGRVLGSANFLDCVEEEGQELGVLIEEKMPPGIPQTPEARRKWFLNEEKRKEWVWRRGREYRWDFCNGMMDFNDFSVRIPGLGFKIDVFKYWDGQPLRFVLKNKRTGEIYGVVQIELREEDERGMQVGRTVVDDGLEERIRETMIDGVE